MKHFDAHNYDRQYVLWSPLNQGKMIVNVYFDVLWTKGNRMIIKMHKIWATDGHRVGHWSVSQAASFMLCLICCIQCRLAICPKHSCFQFNTWLLLSDVTRCFQPAHFLLLGTIWLFMVWNKMKPWVCYDRSWVLYIMYAVLDCWTDPPPLISQSVMETWFVSLFRLTCCCLVHVKKESLLKLTPHPYPPNIDECFVSSLYTRNWFCLQHLALVKHTVHIL